MGGQRLAVNGQLQLNARVTVSHQEIGESPI
jgi:hypothetical protein